MRPRKTFQEVVQELEQGLRDRSIVLASEAKNKSSGILYQATLVEHKESERSYSLRNKYIANMAGIDLVANPAR